MFELADEAGALDEVERHLLALRAALGESPDLRAVIASPIHPREEQGAALAAICRALDIGAPTAGLVGVMAAKRRLFALPDVIGAFTARLARRRGIVSAEVRSALPLTDAQREELSRVLREKTGAQIALEEHVDEALIGGLVVRVGSKMIDTSIRSRLAQLRTVMKEASL